MTAPDKEERNMGTIYYFAKPAHHQHPYTPQLRPRLVTQMQQFDALGRLQETIDLFSIGFLTSRLRRDIRSLVKENNYPPPNLIMTRETVRAAQNAAPGKEGAETAALAGAAAWDMHRGREIGAHGATFWAGGRCWKAARNGEGMYSIAEDSDLETHWSWSRRGQNNRELELRAADTEDVLALLTLGSPGTLSVLQPDGLGVGREDIILLTGVWVAYAEDGLGFQ